MVFNLGLLIGSFAIGGISLFLSHKETISERLILGFLLIVIILLIYISLKRLFRILFLPLRDIIHVDKEAKVLNLRLPKAEKTTLQLDSLFRLEYGYQIDSMHPIFENSHTPWIPPSSVIVYARTKKKQRLPILLIREPNLFYSSHSGLEEFPKALVERLGELLKLPAKFHRHIHIDPYPNKKS